MALRTIRTDDDPILRKKSRPVENYDERLFELLDDMKDTLIKAEGLGLAAVQVGVLRRVVIVNVDGKFVELINPEIVKQSGEQCEPEGCLSLPRRAGVTKRPSNVRIHAYDRFGKLHAYNGTDLMARCFCHEIDHLDGILYSDRLAPGESLYPTEG